MYHTLCTLRGYNSAIGGLMTKFHIKTNRTFTFLRRNAWLFTIVVAIGGLFQPRLGLLVIPVILALTLMSIFRGRYWCGNFCPHGSL